MSNRIISEIERRLKDKAKDGEDVKIDSGLRNDANDLERKLEEARHEYRSLKDKLPSDIKNEMLSFIKEIVSNITGY